MIGIVYAAAGAVMAVFSGYHLALAVAAFFHRTPRAEGRPSSRLVVLVPAHDEATLIARCIRSLRGQTYPHELYRIVVIADNCSDETAEIARIAGAEVLVRHEPDAPGKGRALRWAMDRILSGTSPDGIVVVDADSVADSDFLERLVHPFEHGASAVQGESLLMGDGSPGAALRAAGFLLVNRVRPSGRAVLRLPSHLAGNGMLFSRDLLRRHPWNAFTSTEDLEYSISLRLAEVRITFARGAILRSPAAPSAEAAKHQQLRWEGGKVHVARTRIPMLVAAAFRRRRPSLFEAAFELASPPLGFLAAGAIAGTAAGVVLVVIGTVPPWSLGPWLVADAAIPAYVLLGLRAAQAPASAYRALAQAPLFVLTKIAGAHRLLTFRGDTWVRTERKPRGSDIR